MPMKKRITALEKIGTIQHYPPQTLIYMEQDPGEELYVLLEGEVRCYRYDVKGNMITLPFHAAYDLLGELPLEGEPVAYQESCESETACKMLRLSSLRLCQLASEDLEIANFLIERLSRRSRMLSQFSCITTASSLSEKVALFIYEHEAHFCSMPIARTASMLNIPPESLSRVLKKFRLQGILSNENGVYRVLEREALREYFDFAYYGG
jgi:CRP/FNR family transcriptional regulator